jgi:amidase
MIPGFWEKHADDLTENNRKIYEAGRRALAWQYRGALRRNQAYLEQMREWFRAYDYLICPLDGPAPRLADTEPTARGKGPSPFVFLVQFNFAQTPAAAVPFGFAASGLPLAIQIVGRREDDVGVLRMAAAVETHRPWGLAWPALATDPAVQVLA